MTIAHHIPRTAAALATAAALCFPLAAPAEAGGRITGGVSIELAPRNQQEARALRAGLALYTIAQGIETGAYVDQRGRLNAAAIGQAGLGNTAVIQQRGRGHEAGISQDGNHHAYGIFQFGRAGSAHVRQQGNGQSGLLIQFSH